MQVTPALIQRLCDFVERTARFANFKLIRFFADHKADLVPVEWVDEWKSIDPQAIANDTDTRVHRPGSFASLLHEARSFRFPEYAASNEQHNRYIPFWQNKNLGCKKQAQLFHLGHLLINLCDEHRITRVIDVGCGLGHLLGWLAEHAKNLELVGVDYNQMLCEKGSHLYGNIVFHTIDITDKEAFRRVTYVKDKRTAIVSLHGCGDVQHILINEFLNSDAKLLITIGCCYHKMTPVKGNAWILSEAVRSELKSAVLNVPVFRVATECRLESCFSVTEDWREKRLFAGISRCIMEVFYERMNIGAGREHRSRRRKLGSTFDEIKNTIVERYHVPAEDRERWFQTLDQIIAEYTPQFPKFELLLYLQYFLQEPFEMLILIDRLQYLLENDIRAELMPVFPADVSPRNMCIIASR